MIRIAKKEDLAEIIAIYNESIPERMATADTNEITIEERLKTLIPVTRLARPKQH